MPDYSIREMRRADMNLAIEWAAMEGWNPGLHDADAFYSTDPHGFFIGERDGDPIGCISAVAYDNTFGFIGLYIVKPEYRGQGYGIQLWNHAIHYLGQRNIGLDGVIAQQDNYKKSGFKWAYSNLRFEGSCPVAPSADTIIPTQAVPFDRILEYDKPCFPVPRTTFLQHWLALPNGLSLAKMERNRFWGYGVIRSCRQGHKIGPLFADSQEIAEELLLALCAEAWAKTIYLDVPEINPSGLALAEKYGMKQVFGTARMYTGDSPAMALPKLFGVTTFELG